jgi:hypothetical protein
MQRALGLMAAVAALTIAQPARAAGQPPAAETLANLLGGQTQSPDATATDLARLLIAQFDTDGDGQLNASEIAPALTRSGHTAAPADLNAAIVRLDADGDGKISASELAAGIEQALGAHAAEAGHHHHHHRGLKVGAH